jgi:hypothetical protein
MLHSCELRGSKGHLVVNKLGKYLVMKDILNTEIFKFNITEDNAIDAAKKVYYWLYEVHGTMGDVQEVFILLQLFGMDEV